MAKKTNGLSSNIETINVEELKRVVSLVDICIQFLKDLFVPYHQEVNELINFLMKEFYDS